MSGVALAEIREAILSAYDQRGFQRLLHDRFDIVLSHIAGSGPLRDMVEDVVAHFDREGRLGHLVAEVAADRPARADLAALHDAYAAALVAGGWRTGVGDRVAAELERFGVLPTGELQSGGARLARARAGDAVTSRSAEPVTLSDASPFGGFQKQIRAELPELDVLTWTAQLMRQTCRVCRVELDGTPRGTGFLVGPDAVLTSYHVVGDAIRERRTGERLAFLFDYWRRPNGLEAAGIRARARDSWSDWHIDSSPPLGWHEEHAGEPAATGSELDHALIRLDRPLGDAPVVPGGPPRGWIELPATPPTLTVGMAIAILHHPRTGPVKLTFDTRALLRVNSERTRLRYTTNTAGGSSGAPCLGVNLQLVGMHHFADPARAAPAYNQGIPVEALYQRLARQGKLAALGRESP